jgi:hypothetical protein
LVATERAEGLTDHLFVGKWPVELGGVEEGDPALERAADQVDAFLFRDLGPAAEVEAHAAEANGRNLEAAAAEFTLLHCHFLSRGSLPARR